MARSWKKETASDKRGSRKYRKPPADRGPKPKPYKRAKVWVAKHKRKGKDVTGHFRKATKRRRKK